MKQVMGHDLVADSLGSLFAWRVRRTPEEIGFRFEDQSYSYADMKRMVDRVRASLRRDGARPGDRIAAFMHNSPWLLALFLATATDRLVYCPINVGSRRDDLSYFIRDIEPFAVFVDEALAGVFQSAPLEGLTTRRILVGDSPASKTLINLEQWLEANVAPLTDAVILPSDPLCIMYSGGTTGLPKGIVMPQFAPVAAALRFNGIAKFKQPESFFTTLQLSHAWTPLLVLPFCLYYGHVFCFWKWWSASGFVQWSKKFDASLVDPFIGMIATLLQTPGTPEDRVLQSARLIGGLGGADPVAMRIRAEFEKRFGATTFDLYGFTEITGLAAVETEYHARKPGSSGQLTGWYEVSVVDAHDVPLPVRETGELVLRPRVPHTVGLGYHKKPDVTVATWRNLWIHTGDLGYFDDDGYLFFVGRKNHFLRRRGELISAAEIESVIMGAPGILEAAVTAAKSAFGEDEVRVFVVTNAENFDPQALVDYCNERIASFKVPRYVDVMQTLPRSGTKREIERFRLQERDLALSWDHERHGRHAGESRKKR